MREASPATTPTHPASRIPYPDELKHVAAAMALVKAIRNFGHMARGMDPLGSEPPGDPALDPTPLGLTPEIMARIPADLLRIYVPGRTLAEAYRSCKRRIAARSPTRSSTSGVTRSACGCARYRIGRPQESRSRRS